MIQQDCGAMSLPLHFIHKGSKLEGKVGIHSLDPDSPLYNSYRKGTFLFAKRVIEGSNNL